MYFSVFTSLDHPHQPPQFPHPTLVFHTPLTSPNTTHQLHNGPHNLEIVFRFWFCHQRIVFKFLDSSFYFCLDLAHTTITSESGELVIHIFAPVSE